ncbi:uncharacterized protein MELLADRAFT_75977 [Melampsora larici-populina 98AG31]|uniref:Uncharacterized protein n=1 Tax=Melampsora larici-populina (strain 98AG31 / pathotype 3-4-7) TaxID=747676 RepID=F4S8L0_MELLP|nr:uncharacterized protein MELLADRAFT_75977 [Melampsora larici-populina 98AG31]EGF99008.1 hypothetical protein MELLADRAFT_75977 [Melampsora larici-populina 98AG31]
MRLVEVEDEHERRRREMMEELGLNEFVNRDQRREEVRVTRTSNQIPSSDHRSRSTCSHLAAGLSSSHPSPKRFINPQIITPKKPVNNLMSGFQSMTHTPLVMGNVNEVEHDHRSPLEHESRNLNPAMGIEVGSMVGELGHAEIALQGIAAILRLAKSPS